MILEGAVPAALMALLASFCSIFSGARSFLGDCGVRQQAK